MSSPRSPQRAEAFAALGGAAVRVAEDSFFAYAEPCEPTRTARLMQARPVDEPWLAVAIAFTGPFDGVVQVSLPRSLAADLGGAFCGVRPQSLDGAQIADFAGELANMMCGLWLTQTHRSDRFALAAPVVTQAAAGDVAASADADPDGLGIVVNDTPLLLALSAGKPVVSA
ncbi:MAG: chemotaxis protein CheX [Vicinamibacteraceae bacterium]